MIVPRLERRLRDAMQFIADHRVSGFGKVATWFRSGELKSIMSDAALGAKPFAMHRGLREINLG